MQPQPLAQVRVLGALGVERADQQDRLRALHFTPPPIGTAATLPNVLPVHGRVWLDDGMHDARQRAVPRARLRPARGAGAGGELGVTELANRTGLVPSTAHRLLHTLAKRGYVSQSRESGRYLLGYKVVEVASGLEHRLERLRAVARPHLEGIQRETGETVNLVVLDADRVVYVDQVEGSRNVRMFTTVGTSVPAHTTGSGKAIMAYGPPEALAALYGGREPLERADRAHADDARRARGRLRAHPPPRLRARQRGARGGRRLRRRAGVRPHAAGRARRSACRARPRGSCTTRPAGRAADRAREASDAGSTAGRLNCGIREADRPAVAGSLSTRRLDAPRQRSRRPLSRG